MRSVNLVGFAPVKSSTIRGALSQFSRSIALQSEAKIHLTYSTMYHRHLIRQHCQLAFPEHKYSYPLLIIEYGIRQYPAVVHADPWKDGRLVQNQIELIDTLNYLFNHQSTRKIIQQIKNLRCV